MACIKKYFLAAAMILVPLVSFSAVTIGGALDVMYERGMDLSVGGQGYYDLLVLNKSQDYYFGLEYFAQSTTPVTGQQTYSLQRFRRGGFLEFLSPAAQWGAFNPFVSAGVGGFQDVVTTAFMTSSVEDTSRFYICGFGGLGLKFDYTEPIFLAVELRLIFGENLDPQPTISNRAILGYTF